MTPQIISDYFECVQTVVERNAPKTGHISYLIVMKRRFFSTNLPRKWWSPDDQGTAACWRMVQGSTSQSLVVLVQQVQLSILSIRWRAIREEWPINGKYRSSDTVIVYGEIYFERFVTSLTRFAIFFWDGNQSLPISLVMIERIYILCLIIIIKSEVWTIV